MNEKAGIDLNTLLRIENLGFRYKRQGYWLFQGVNLTVNCGETTVIYGAAGSGKTTLAELICGFKEPMRGWLKRTEEFVTAAQEFDLYRDLTVAENLDFIAMINQSKGTGLKFSLSQFGLNGYEDTRANELPGALRKMLQLAAVARREFGLLVLDEPTLGLDRDLRIKFGEVISKLEQLGKGILIFTTNEADLTLGKNHLELKDGVLTEKELRPLSINDSPLETREAEI